MFCVRYCIFIFLFLILSCGSSDDGASDKVNSGGSGVSSGKNKENITRLEYYKDYEQSYDGRTSYIGLIDKEAAKGIAHIRLYYSSNNIVREEEYDKGGSLIRYTKPFYSSSGKKLSEKWYDNRDNIILERFYKGIILSEDIVFSDGVKSGRTKYLYNSNNILVREKHYNTYNDLLFYKEFDYNGEVLVRSHFYSPDGSKISTHKEYHSTAKEGSGYDKAGDNLKRLEGGEKSDNSSKAKAQY